MTLPDFDRLPWDGPDRLVFDGVAVEFCVPPALYERESSDGRFVLGKSPDMLRSLLRELGGRAPRRIVDLGVFKGGSVVMLNEVFRPDAMLAVEIDPRGLPPLDRYLGARGQGRILWARGLDQANRAGLHEGCDRAFGDAPIDLVVDDASHWYPETLASFTALFPRVAPGGLYVIEDWGWAHWPDPYWQRDHGGPHFAGRVPPSNLVVDLALMVAAAPRVFAHVSIDHAAIYVTRGDGPLPRDFDPHRYQHNRGQPLPRFAPSVAEKPPAFESPQFVIRGGGR